MTPFNFFWQVLTNNANLSVITEVLGVTDGPAVGMMELLLLDQEPVLIEQQLWDPLEAILEKGKLFVSVDIVGGKIIRIEAVDPPSEE